MQPPEDKAAAQNVLAYFSMVAIMLMMVITGLCTYCFFYADVQHFLFVISSGKMGKSRHLSMPRALQQITLGSQSSDLDPRPRGRKHKLLKMQEDTIPASCVKVVVDSKALTRTKRIDASACSTISELRATIWEECGHLLKGVTQKEAILLCQPRDYENQGRWLTVAAASDFEKVVKCGVLKLTSRELLDSNVDPPVAFVKALCGGRLTSSSASARCKLFEGHGRNGDIKKVGLETNVDNSDGEDMPLISESCETASCSNVPLQLEDPTQSHRPNPGGLTFDHDEVHDTFEQWDAAGSIAFTRGQRVRVVNLVAMPDLNGTLGVIENLDLAKGRYRVRLDCSEVKPKVFGFKTANLIPV